MLKNLPATICLVCGLLLFVGCADSGPHVVEVEGRITYQEQPVTKGKVLFSPRGQARVGAARPAMGRISEDGSYAMRVFGDRPGIQPGEYQVAIQSYNGTFIDKSVVYLVPKKYADSATSGLTATVPEDANGTLEISFSLP